MHDLSLLFENGYLVRRLLMMLDILKNIPLIGNVSISDESGAIMMTVDSHHARGYLCSLSLVLAIFIEDSDDLSIGELRYVTLLLASCPELYDYAIQLTSEGGWVCCLYGKDTTSESLSKEIEKQLVLTHYLQSMLSRRRQSRQDE